MIETYLRSRSNLKAVVVIVDIRRDFTKADFDLLHYLERFGKKAIVVLTKVDKLSRQQCRSRVNEITKQLTGVEEDRPIRFSAKTREGREEIWKKVLESMGFDAHQGHRP